MMQTCCVGPLSQEEGLKVEQPGKKRVQVNGWAKKRKQRTKGRALSGQHH